MNLTLNRRKAAPAELVPAQRTRPLYELTESGGRTDLCCSTCGRAIAFGVRAERLDDDGPFFLEAHAPFCLRVTRS